MLSATHATKAADLLVGQMGEVAIAAALLRAHEAEADGRLRAMGDWRLIAHLAAQRLRMHQ